MGLLAYAEESEIDLLLPVLSAVGRASFPDAVMTMLRDHLGASAVEAFFQRDSKRELVRAFASANDGRSMKGCPLGVDVRGFRDGAPGRTAILWPTSPGQPLLVVLERGDVCMLVIHGDLSGEGVRARVGRIAHAVMTAAFAHAELATRPRAFRPMPLPALEERFRSIHPTLSAREREVCARTVSGMTAEAISLDLSISTTTVSTYRRRAYQRMGISSAYELLGSLITDEGWAATAYQAAA